MQIGHELDDRANAEEYGQQHHTDTSRAGDEHRDADTGSRIDGLTPSLRAAIRTHFAQDVGEQLLLHSDSSHTPLSDVDLVVSDPIRSIDVVMWAFGSFRIDAGDVEEIHEASGSFCWSA
ncbi:hypothetical protein ACIP5Y_42545, partial [Nocardia sp. NPDC088792]|uniref:hypothetical protein n=1 Tax=Nocardia sp. NPDC088792 TaxID=3364332 RepID=UPI00380D4960